MDELGLTHTTSVAAARLREHGVDPDGLAEFVPARKVMLIRRPATMRPLGEVWRVGTLLLSVDSERVDSERVTSERVISERATPELASPLFLAGPATRAAKRLYPGNQSISREERRDIAAAALAGGYPEGRAVHYDAIPVPLDAQQLRELGPEHPLGVVGDVIRVRWRAGASLEGAPTLADYLAERIDLLINRESA